MSLSACSREISNQQIIAYTAPDIIEYDKKTQAVAAVEMQEYCAKTPIMCKFIGDYGTMRDQARIVKGVKLP